MEKELAILNLELEHFNPNEDNIDVKVESIGKKLRIKVLLVKKLIPHVKATKLQLSLD